MEYVIMLTKLVIIEKMKDKRAKKLLLLLFGDNFKGASKSTGGADSFADSTPVAFFSLYHGNGVLRQYYGSAMADLDTQSTQVAFCSVYLRHPGHCLAFTLPI